MLRERRAGHEQVVGRLAAEQFWQARHGVGVEATIVKGLPGKGSPNIAMPILYGPDTSERYDAV